MESNIRSTNRYKVVDKYIPQESQHSPSQERKRKSPLERYHEYNETITKPNHIMPVYERRGRGGYDQKEHEDAKRIA